MSELIILQSAGSLAVAIIALLMLVVQAVFFFRKPQFTWYAWSAVGSFSAFLYAVGIFLEYNTPQGDLNRFSGLLEFTAIICLVHCLYGFTFSYLGIENKRYHPIAAGCHGLILILLWCTPYIVADSFIKRHFMGLVSPYIEPALGPLGPVFMLYVAISGVGAVIIWIRHKKTDPKHRFIYLSGMGFWILLGIHDGLAAMGLPTFQYVMEYGFLGFALAILWVAFNSDLEISAENKYRVITEFANDCILVIQDGKMVFGNPAYCDLIGWALGDSTPGDLFDILAPEDRKRILEHYKTLLDGDSVPNPDTVPIQRSDGKRRFVEIASNVILYRNRPAILAVMRDMTERKQAEDALREGEKKYRALYGESKKAEEVYRSLLHTSADAMVMYNLKGRVVYLSPAFTALFGWTLEEAAGTRLEFMAESGKSENLEKIIEDGNAVQGLETKGLKKDGRLIHVSISGSRYNDHRGRPAGMLIVIRDTSLRKKLEKQLQRAKNMEAIGTLAGGVAHDLNNMLGGIVGYPELLLLKLPHGTPLRKPILTIKKSGEKAAAIVQDLLTLARRGVMATEVVNPNDIVLEYLESPEHGKLQSYHPGVHVETRLGDDVLNIWGSPTHLSKTVMNLINNAAEAMPQGGKIVVSTENRYINKPLSGYDEVKEGDYVALTISDTGIGISMQDMDKIFEPFYTKKKMGRSGTGLGMTVVWGTVKDHKGYIDVKSMDGKGTTFTLYFPITRKPLPENKVHIPIESYYGNGESILIVDDVEEQRQIASDMLRTLGYSTVSISSGEAAIEYLTTNKPELLLLDMVMDPGMDGLETYQKILETNPGQKTIIVSGFSKTDRVKEVQRLGAETYMAKPFQLEKIGITIKEELSK